MTNFLLHNQLLKSNQTKYLVTIKIQFIHILMYKCSDAVMTCSNNLRTTL